MEKLGWMPVSPDRRDKPHAPKAEPGLVTSAAPTASPKESSMFEAEVPRWRFDELIVSSNVREELEAVLAKVRHHKKLYEDWGLAEIDRGGKRTAVNLYGPPGTGKTMGAHAVAAALSMKILTVDYAGLESKYVGDTPKNIRAAFQAAASQGAVIFFDEADSVLGKRLTSVTQSADHGVNVSRAQMLTELDRFDGVVIFATNLAGNYDPAFVRRILAHVAFQLPDQEARARLWAAHLPTRLPRNEDVRPETLAAFSEGLSGGDVRNAVVAAASGAVARTDGLDRVTLEDLRREADRILRSKREVGHRPAPEVTPATVVD